MDIISLCDSCRDAAFALANSDTALRNRILTTAADMLVAESDALLAENAKDLENARKSGMKESFIDRLSLSAKRIADMADGMRHVASLPDPLGGGSVWTRPNGLEIKCIHVPLGVIGIIYEARPNVTSDAAALCIKSGNGVVLRGGSDAINSNTAIADIIKKSLEKCGISTDAVQLVTDTSRMSATTLMKAKGHIDLLIPRGGKGTVGRSGGCDRRRDRGVGQSRRDACDGGTVRGAPDPLALDRRFSLSEEPNAQRDARRLRTGYLSRQPRTLHTIHSTGRKIRDPRHQKAPCAACGTGRRRRRGNRSRRHDPRHARQTG